MRVDKELDAVVHRPGVCTGCGGDLPRDAPAHYCPKCVAGARGAEVEPIDQSSEARKELAARELARRRLLPFVKRLKKGYRAGWFHMDLAARLERFVRRVEAGDSPRMIITVPPRHGKELADQTPILTTSGWTSHGELRPGDYVFHPSGKPIEVLAVHPPGIDAMEIEFTNGEVIQCHEAHEWTVHHRSTKRWMTVETRWFLERTKRGIKAGQPRSLWTGPKGKRGGRAMYQLPLAQPLEMPEQKLPLDPYVLGAWLGDGTCGSPVLTNSKEDYEVLVAALAAREVRCTKTYIHRDYGTYRSYYGDGALAAPLRELGVYHEKSVPAPYLRGSVDQRLELLAGLVDTDGYVEPGTSRVIVVTTSEALRDGILDLCTTLGFRPYLADEVPPGLSTSGIEGRRTVYYIGFQPTLPIPTRIPRKRVTRLARQRRIGIRDVRRAEHPAVGRCITVDSPDGLYLAGRQLIPTHNSELASKALVAWFLGRNPTCSVISATHSDRLAMDNSRDVLNYTKEPSFRTVFPDFALDKDNKAAMGWRTEQGGYYKPVGVGAGIAGYGAHILAIDDPHRDREAYSPTVRDAIWRWYNSSAITRLMPGGGALIIQTRWHLADLTGRVLDEEGRIEDGGDWEVVCYPAVAEHDEYRLPDGRIVTEYSPSATLLRKKGEPLHPQRYPMRLLEKYKRDPQTWAALYQQNPTAGEVAQFPPEMVDAAECYLADIPKQLVHYSTWDLAIGLKDGNDYTVCITGGVDEADTLWIVDLERDRCDGYEIVERLIDSYLRFHQDAIGVEKSHLSMAIGPFLEKRLEERRVYGANVIDLAHGNKDKVARARPIQARMRQGKVKIPKDAPWYDEFRRELVQFPAGRHDDMCVAAGTRISTPRGPRPIESIQVGDYVTTPAGPKRVLAAGQTGCSELLRLRTAAGRSLDATANHPISSPNQGFVRMDALTCSGAIHCGEAPGAVGPTGVESVQSVERLPGKHPVYNLTVEDAHVYFANGVLTHNCDAFAWLGSLLEDMIVPTRPRGERKKSWRDRLGGSGRRGKSWRTA